MFVLFTELFPPILLAKKTEAWRSERQTRQKTQVIKANVRCILLLSMSGLRQISEALCKPHVPSCKKSIHTVKTALRIIRIMYRVATPIMAI